MFNILYFLNLNLGLNLEMDLAQILGFVFIGCITGQLILNFFFGSLIFFLFLIF